MKPAKLRRTDTPVQSGPIEVRYQLWFEQFRDLIVFSLSISGGIITLLGTVFREAPDRRAPVMCVLAAGLAALLSLLGQNTIVDRADKGQLPGRSDRYLRGLALALVGAALGAFLAFATDALGTRPGAGSVP